MSVNEIDTVVLLFPNEEWTNTATDTQLNSVVAQLRPNISYALYTDENLQTLSTHNADESGTIGGFLYVPDLDRDDPCVALSAAYVPKNVTRQANLPPTDFTLVALAPWINAECTLAYLNAAHQDPMRGFIFYLPDNGTAQPPPPSSPVWDLGDAGKWKNTFGYPVYAVPSNIGQELIYQSSLYSGNMTSVPYGHQISELPGIDPRDYVRMYTEIHISTATTLPSLWILLMIIIAILFLMLGITSGTMHLILRSRRKSLQRRVANGEVDLEALGIKRLTVPREQITRLPLFTFNFEEDSVSPASVRAKKVSTSTATTVEHDNASEGSSSGHVSKSQDLPAPLSSVSAIDDTVSSPGSTYTHKSLPYSQPACPICLDDFESGITTIRELPCGHIFHPDCIDSFLSNNSSLCPMCKRTVLPRGYCSVKITNAIVRRERNIRRLRSRVMINDEEGDVESDDARNRMRRYKANFRRALLHSTTGSRVPEEPVMMHMESHAVMTNAMPDDRQVSVLGNEVPRNLAPGVTRQDIAQQRIRELAAGQSLLDDPEVTEERRRPKWRRLLSRMFPGF